MKNSENNCKRKNKIHLWQIGVLLFGMFFIITNCNSNIDAILENDNLNDSQKSGNTVEQVFIDDIPNIANSIYGISNKAKGLSYKKESQNFTIDTERIIKATDSVGNLTYAFEIITTNEPDNILHNLIVTQRVDGKQMPAFIVKYEFENATKYDYAVPTDELKFEAKTSIYSYEAFLQTGTLQSKAANNKSTSDGTDPCFEIDSTTGSGGGGGYDDLDGESFIEQTSTVGNFYTYTIPKTGSSGGGGGGSKGKVICGELTMIGMTVNSANKSQNTKTQAKETTGDAPCPEGEILLPINKNFFKIDDDELKGKEKCLNYLLTEKGTDYVKTLLNNFEGKSEFDIKIVSKDRVTIIDDNGNAKEVNGTTSGIINSIITISINSSLAIDRSGLDVARTILHEYIHADIRRKLKTKSPSDSDKEFRDIFEQYGNDHHEAMGDLYVNSMRDAMKHFHKNVLTDDYNKYTNHYEEEPSDDFYEALAWRGLKEHKVKAWTALSSERQTEINNLSLRVDVLTKAVNCSD